jgi:hypothetical protein
MVIPMLLLLTIFLGALSAVGPIGSPDFRLPWAYLASRGVSRSWLGRCTAAFACVAVTTGVVLATLTIDGGSREDDRSLRLDAEVARKAQRLVAATGGQLLVHEIQWPEQALVAGWKPPNLVETEVPGAISFVRMASAIAFLVGLLLVAPPRMRSGPGRRLAVLVLSVVVLPLVSPLATAFLPEVQRERLTGMALVALAWAINHGSTLLVAAVLMAGAAAAISTLQWRKGDFL